MSAENKFVTNQKNILEQYNTINSIRIGIVVETNDPLKLNRIKVRIPGSAVMGGDDNVSDNDLQWAVPLTPIFYTSMPKLGEGVFILSFNNQKATSDRLYIGPIISQVYDLNYSPLNTTALSSFSFGSIAPKVNYDNIPALTGVFPKNDDIAIQGRFNTDIRLSTNETTIRVGKFSQSPINENNPFPIQFNNTTQGYIQIRNDVPLTVSQQNINQNTGTVMNLVANKINLITHEDGSPRFDVLNQENLTSNEEILNILTNAHPLPFGDILVNYLKLLRSAFLNHVHNGNKATDLITSGNQQFVDEFKKKAEDLENKMLSKNIRIN